MATRTHEPHGPLARYAGTAAAPSRVVAALLLLLTLTAWAGVRAPVRLPWGRSAALRVGVVGWWNATVLPGAGLPRALGAALVAAQPGACGTAAPVGAYTATLLLHGGRASGQVAWEGTTLWWQGCAFALPSDAQWLLAGAAAAAREGWAGQLLAWPVVDLAFPRGTRAVVTDWRTGRALTVVRWGGRLHADVEPATARDAVTLRAMYGGARSWARRPVVVTLPGGQRVAASINGMPHGGGAVGGNAFPGHFCVHFLASAVHRSGRIDEGHLLAILTAAGLGPGGFGAARGGPAAVPAAAGPPPVVCS